MRSIFILLFACLMLSAPANADPIPLNFDASLNAGNAGTHTASGVLAAGETLTFAITVPQNPILPDGNLAEGLRVVTTKFLPALLYTDPAQPEENLENQFGLQNDFLAPLFAPGRTFYVRVGDPAGNTPESYQITSSAVIVKDAGTLPATAGEVFYDSGESLPAPGFQTIDVAAYYKVTIPPGNAGIFLVELSRPGTSSTDLLLAGRQGKSTWAFGNHSTVLRSHPDLLARNAGDFREPALGGFGYCAGSGARYPGNGAGHLLFTSNRWPRAARLLPSPPENRPWQSAGVAGWHGRFRRGASRGLAMVPFCHAGSAAARSDLYRHRWP